MRADLVAGPTHSCLDPPPVVRDGENTFGDNVTMVRQLLFSLIQSDWREATESARSDAVSQLCSSCDSRSRVCASGGHQLADRLIMSDGRRVRLGTRLIQ